MHFASKHESFVQGGIISSKVINTTNFHPLCYLSNARGYEVKLQSEILFLHEITIFGYLTYKILNYTLKKQDLESKNNSNMKKKFPYKDHISKICWNYPAM